MDPGIGKLTDASTGDRNAAGSSRAGGGGSSGDGGAGGEGVGVDSGGFFAELITLAEKAAMVDPSMDSALVRDTALMDATAELERVIDLLRVTETHLLVALDQSAATHNEVGLITGTWLARAAEQPRSRCQGRVRMANRLHLEFPFLIEAARLGRLSWAQVEVIDAATNARNRDAMKGWCPTFIRWTEGNFAGRFDRWAAKVRRVANQLDEDGSNDPNNDLHANRLRLSPLPDATREVAGRLVGDAAVTVNTTLENIADELFAEFQQAHNAEGSVTIPSRQTLMALALVEACKRMMGVPAGSSKPPKTDAVLIIEQDDDGHATVHTSDGDWVPRSAADALLFNADVRALLTDSDASPLHLGRRVRLATDDQRLVMNIRDGGCLFPGCERPARWSHAHHEPPWTHAGRTDIDTLAAFCGADHGTIHRNGWTRRPNPNQAQSWLITTPTGRTLRTERNPRT